MSRPQNVSSSVIRVAMNVGSVKFDGVWTHGCGLIGHRS